MTLTRHSRPTSRLCSVWLSGWRSCTTITTECAKPWAACQIGPISTISNFVWASAWIHWRRDSIGLSTLDRLERPRLVQNGSGCDSTLCGLWWGFGERGKPDYGDDETE